MLKVTHNRLLVQPLDSQTELGNGISITNETQSRKDVIKARVIDGIIEGNVVYFPLYAALPISYEGNNYLVINKDDVLAYDTRDSE